MLSIPKSELLTIRTDKILDSPLPVTLSQKAQFYKEFENDGGEPYTIEHLKQKRENNEFIFSKVIVDYMTNPFNLRHIEAFKKMFKGFPYSVNMHTLTDKPVAHVVDKKGYINVNGECVNQLYLSAPIYHILFAAQSDTTTSKNLTKKEVVLDLQYMSLFLFGANTLN